MRVAVGRDAVEVTKRKVAALAETVDKYKCEHLSTCLAGLQIFFLYLHVVGWDCGFGLGLELRLR